MKQKLLPVILTLALLVSLFAFTGAFASAEAEVYVTYAKYFPDRGSFLSGKLATDANGGALADGAGMMTDDAYSTTATDAWTPSSDKVVFNMNGEFEVDTFLVSSVADENAYIQKVKIYVGNDRSTLFDEANLAISTDLKEKGGRITQEGKTVQHAMISLMESSYVMFKCRYIGFDFSDPANAGYKVGELGAYGKSRAGLATFEFVEVLPDERNLLGDAVAYDRFWSATSGVRPQTTTGDLAFLYDGYICSNDDQKDGGKRWGGYFNNGDKLIVDLAEEVNLLKFLIGSEGGIEMRVQYMKIYVGNDKENLFKADNLVFEKHGGIAGRNHTVTFDKANIVGRYVGFDFTDNNRADGNAMLYFFRLGELGIYGLATPKTEVKNEHEGVRLTWDVDGTSRGHYVYRQERNADSGWDDQWTQIANVDTDTYLDEDVSTGKYYRYMVRSYYGDNMSPEYTSDTLQREVPPPTQPTTTTTTVADAPATTTTAAAATTTTKGEVVSQPTTEDASLDEENASSDEDADGETEDESEEETKETTKTTKKDKKPTASKNQSEGIPVWVWIVIGGVLVLAGVGVGLFLWLKKPKANS